MCAPETSNCTPSKPGYTFSHLVYITWQLFGPQGLKSCSLCAGCQLNKVQHHENTSKHETIWPDWCTSRQQQWRQCQRVSCKRAAVIGGSEILCREKYMLGRAKYIMQGLYLQTYILGIARIVMVQYIVYKRAMLVQTSCQAMCAHDHQFPLVCATVATWASMRSRV